MSKNNYKLIFKSTFLFGFVQVINISVKIILNKVIAITLGSKGIGLVGLYTSVIGMLKTGAGLGISQSAVRDISEANEKNNVVSFSKTIITTNKIILFTSLSGLFLTVILSPLLSKWAFGNNTEIISFIILSIAVALTIFWEGQLAILKGMRRLRLLAKANIFGATAGLVISVPLYLIYEAQGIIPVLIVTPLCSLIVSVYYCHKINYKRIKLSLKDVIKRASPMMRMGIALAFTTFLSHLSTFIISAYIGNQSGLAELGFYNAGVMIMIGYFSIVINALTTDYYPRISAVNSDNIKLQNELNQQSIVSLIISFPLVVLFLFLLPLLVTILYSTEFYPVIDFVRIGIYGILITIFSNQVDLILIAKNNTKTFTKIAILIRVIEVALNIILYNYYGLIGLGISLIFCGFLHLLVMVIVVNKLYSIRFQPMFIKYAIYALFFIFITSLASNIEDFLLRNLIGIILFSFSLTLSFYFSQRYLNYNFSELVIKSYYNFKNKISNN